MNKRNLFETPRQIFLKNWICDQFLLTLSKLLDLTKNCKF